MALQRAFKFAAPFLAFEVRLRYRHPFLGVHTEELDYENCHLAHLGFCNLMLCYTAPTYPWEGFGPGLVHRPLEARVGGVCSLFKSSYGCVILRNLANDNVGVAVPWIELNHVETASQRQGTTFHFLFRKFFGHDELPSIKLIFGCEDQLIASTHAKNTEAICL